MQKETHQSVAAAILAIGIYGMSMIATNPLYGAENDNKTPSFTLKNEHIRATFMAADGVCRLSALSRADGSDALPLNSDEFEVLLFDKSRVTADHYETESVENDAKSLVLTLKRRKDVAETMPAVITVAYTVSEGPYLYKDVALVMKEGQTIDRLQVLRFSAQETATRGGHGQPVFVGNWFCGINYPCFYSRHSSTFVEPNIHYRWHYSIDLEGGDKEYAPRDGLVTLFHFPGLAKKQGDGSWRIQGKRAVIGIAKKKDEGPELGLLDYIEANRKPSRSYLHFNNWYTPEAKKISVEDFVNNVAVKLKTNLEKYGAHVDAMVPDDGWQQTNKFKSIYESRFPMPEVNKALRKMNVDLGIWVAIDGTSTSISDGEKVGYEVANPKSFTKYDARRGFWGPQQYFNILNPKYQEDYKKAVRYLLQDSDVRYIKHDFNHMYTYNHLTERHSREACLDVTLDLLAYERELNPKVIINYTNGSFFTPFWLLFVEYLWMNSGDTGESRNVPQICDLEDATTYRDSHFHQSFNNPGRTVRPIVPIANFMTHGILHSSTTKYFDPKTDPVQEWLNYLVMYYGRGTLLKELYLSPDTLTDDMWKALGTASAWAQKNENLMRNTVLVGGDANEGKVYGYVSWQGDRAMLTVRNPNRQRQTLEVPFDASVYYRGAVNKTFRARAIYPFVEHMPWELLSGRAFSFEVPGDSVMAFELTEGAPLTKSMATPQPLPPVVAANGTKEGYEIKLKIPDEDFPRHELILYHQGESPTIDGAPVAPSRTSKALMSYDLRSYRGKTISVAGKTPGLKQAWLIVDRKVDAPAPATQKGDVLPWAIGQNHRRLTQEIVIAPREPE